MKLAVPSVELENLVFSSWKEKKHKAEPHNYIEFFLITDTGNEVLAISAEDHGNSHYVYHSTGTFAKYGALNSKNRADTISWLEMIIKESQLKVDSKLAEEVAHAGEPTPDNPLGIYFTQHKVEKNSNPDGTHTQRFFLLDQFGSWHLAVIGEERETRDGHYLYKATEEFSSRHPLHCHSQKDVIHWLEQRVTHNLLQAPSPMAGQRSSTPGGVGSAAGGGDTSIGAGPQGTRHTSLSGQASGNSPPGPSCGAGSMADSGAGGLQAVHTGLHFKQQVAAAGSTDQHRQQQHNHHHNHHQHRHGHSGLPPEQSPELTPDAGRRTPVSSGTPMVHQSPGQAENGFGPPASGFADPVGSFTAAQGLQGATPQTVSAGCIGGGGGSFPNLQTAGPLANGPSCQPFQPPPSPPQQQQSAQLLPQQLTGPQLDANQLLQQQHHMHGQFQQSHDPTGAGAALQQQFQHQQVMLPLQSQQPLPLHTGQTPVFGANGGSGSQDLTFGMPGQGQTLMPLQQHMAQQQVGQHQGQQPTSAMNAATGQLGDFQMGFQFQVPQQLGAQSQQLGQPSLSFGSQQQMPQGPGALGALMGGVSPNASANAMGFQAQADMQSNFMFQSSLQQQLQNQSSTQPQQQLQSALPPQQQLQHALTLQQQISQQLLPLPQQPQHQGQQLPQQLQQFPQGQQQQSTVQGVPSMGGFSFDSAQMRQSGLPLSQQFSHLGGPGSSMSGLPPLSSTSAAGGWTPQGMPFPGQSAGQGSGPGTDMGGMTAQGPTSGLMPGLSSPYGSMPGSLTGMALPGPPGVGVGGLSTPQLSSGMELGMEGWQMDPSIFGMGGGAAGPLSPAFPTQSQPQSQGPLYPQPMSQQQSGGGMSGLGMGGAALDPSTAAGAGGPLAAQAGPGGGALCFGASAPGASFGAAGGGAGAAPGTQLPQPFASVGAQGALPAARSKETGHGSAHLGGRGSTGGRGSGNKHKLAGVAEMAHKRKLARLVAAGEEPVRAAQWAYIASLRQAAQVEAAQQEALRKTIASWVRGQISDDEVSVNSYIDSLEQMLRDADRTRTVTVPFLSKDQLLQLTRGTAEGASLNAVFTQPGSLENLPSPSPSAQAAVPPVSQGVPPLSADAGANAGSAASLPAAPPAVPTSAQAPIAQTPQGQSPAALPPPSLPPAPAPPAAASPAPEGLQTAAQEPTPAASMPYQAEQLAAVSSLKALLMEDSESVLGGGFRLTGAPVPDDPGGGASFPPSSLAAGNSAEPPDGTAGLSGMGEGLSGGSADQAAGCQGAAVPLQQRPPDSGILTGGSQVQQPKPEQAGTTCTSQLYGDHHTGQARAGPAGSIAPSGGASSAAVEPSLPSSHLQPQGAQPGSSPPAGPSEAPASMSSALDAAVPKVADPQPACGSVPTTPPVPSLSVKSPGPVGAAATVACAGTAQSWAFSDPQTSRHGVRIALESLREVAALCPPISHMATSKLVDMVKAYTSHPHPAVSGLASDILKRWRGTLIHRLRSMSDARCYQDPVATLEAKIQANEIAFPSWCDLAGSNKGTATSGAAAAAEGTPLLATTSSVTPTPTAGIRPHVFSSGYPMAATPASATPAAATPHTVALPPPTHLVPPMHAVPSAATAAAAAAPPLPQQPQPAAAHTPATPTPAAIATVTPGATGPVSTTGPASLASTPAMAGPGADSQATTPTSLSLAVGTPTGMMTGGTAVSSGPSTYTSAPRVVATSTNDGRAGVFDVPALTAGGTAAQYPTPQLFSRHASIAAGGQDALRVPMASLEAAAGVQLQSEPSYGLFQPQSSPSGRTATGAGVSPSSPGLAFTSANAITASAPPMAGTEATLPAPSAAVAAQAVPMMIPTAHSTCSVRTTMPVAAALPPSPSSAAAVAPPEPAPEEGAAASAASPTSLHTMQPPPGTPGAPGPAGPAPSQPVQHKLPSTAPCGTPGHLTGSTVPGPIRPGQPQALPSLIQATAEVAVLLATSSRSLAALMRGGSGAGGQPRAMSSSQLSQLQALASTMAAFIPSLTASRNAARDAAAAAGNGSNSSQAAPAAAVAALAAMQQQYRELQQDLGLADVDLGATASQPLFVPPSASKREQVLLQPSGPQGRSTLALQVQQVSVQSTTSQHGGSQASLQQLTQGAGPQLISAAPLAVPSAGIGGEFTATAVENMPRRRMEEQGVGDAPTTTITPHAPGWVATTGSANSFAPAFAALQAADGPGTVSGTPYESQRDGGEAAGTGMPIAGAAVGSGGDETGARDKGTGGGGAGTAPLPGQARKDADGDAVMGEATAGSGDGAGSSVPVTN